jgi:hypothetical protein
MYLFGNALIIGNVTTFSIIRPLTYTGKNAYPTGVPFEKMRLYNVGNFDTYLSKVSSLSIFLRGDVVKRKK